MLMAGTTLAPAWAAGDSPVLAVLKSAALSGDLRPVGQLATERDRQLPADSGDQLGEILLLQYRERFVALNELPGLGIETGSARLLSDAPENSLAAMAIAAYQRYWRSVLTRSMPAEQADHELQMTIGELLARHYSDPEAGYEPVPCGDQGDGISRIDIFHCLERALAELGLGSKADTTPPWRDLYIWTEQHTSNYEVELTDSIEQVKVTFINQPLVQGWQHYASLDLLTTSGWATSEGLFCFCWSYDLDSPAFQVSWLKHETQHIVDFREFPGMSEAQLEYRAKLTELAFSGHEVSALLRQFSESGSTAGESAHSEANYRVSRDIYHKMFRRELPEGLDPWQQLGPHQVAKAARALLQQDSQQLKVKP